MKPLSTVIILMLLAGVQASVPGGIRAQQSSVSNQQLSERLLDAVDGNDVETVRSIIAIASGRALVASPIGLRAAGRAVERGYYEVAHHILAVRTQQRQFENEEGAEEELASDEEGAEEVISPPKSEENEGEEQDEQEGGEVDLGGATDGGGSTFSAKRRGVRGGKKHRKKSKQDHPDWSSTGSWNRIPGSASGSDSSWKKNYTRNGGYLSAAQKTRGWR